MLFLRQADAAHIFALQRQHTCSPLAAQHKTHYKQSIQTVLRALAAKSVWVGMP